MIKFHLLLGKSPMEIHQVMEQALQEFCPSYETIRRWVVAIREGKEDLDDEARTGRPVNATSPDVEEKVAAAVRQDRRLTTRQMSQMVGVSHNSVHKILTENLGKRKVCAKWVPHLLTDERQSWAASQTRGAGVVGVLELGDAASPSVFAGSQSLRLFSLPEDQGAHAWTPVHHRRGSQRGVQGEFGDRDQVWSSRWHRWPGAQVEEVSRG